METVSNLVTMSSTTNNDVDNPALEGMFRLDEDGKLIRIGNATNDPWRKNFMVTPENNTGALAWIKSNPSAFNKDADEDGEESVGVLSDGVAQGSDEDSDEDESMKDCIYFLSCDLCGIVLVNPDEAWNHEESCTHPPNTNRVPRETDLIFFNKHDVFVFICKYMTARDRPINESDLIYFVKPTEHTL